MAQQHTPGPWRLAGLAGIEDQDDQRVIEKFDGYTIATAWIMGDDNSRADAPERDANARLIVASPDLLDACIQALDHVFGGRYECNCGGPDTEDGCTGTCTRSLLLRAVAKATGQSKQEMLAKYPGPWGPD